MASATLIAGHPAALASSQATRHTSKHNSLSARHASSFHGSLLARPATSAAASATAQQQRGARLQVNARCGPSGSWRPYVYRMPGFYASVWGSPAMQQWQKQAQQTVQEAAQQQGLWFPVDVLESDTQYQYVADVPGLGKSDIQVQVDKDRMLTVSGERAFKEAATASKADSAPPTTEQAGTSDAVDVTDSSQDTQEQQKPEWRRTRKERRFGSFKRSWTLPEDADLSRINARVEKGVLTLTVNRVKPVEPEVTTINID